MESVVPIFGHEALNGNVLLKNRIKSIVEDDLGHSARFTDTGSVADLHHSNLLRIVIPFTITVAGAVDGILKEDFLTPLEVLFPLAINLEAIAEHIPAVLKRQAEALSLGHVNGGPSDIRRAMKVIYQYLSKPDFNVAFLSQTLGLSKSTLERAFTKWGDTGVGHAVQKIRLMEAYRLAVTTNFKIEAISFAVGYENLSSFDRAFNREFGTSVTTLRQDANSMSRNAKQMSHSAQ
jgi:AraC-like DNA-binding protein